MYSLNYLSGKASELFFSSFITDEHKLGNFLISWIYYLIVLGSQENGHGFTVWVSKGYNQAISSASSIREKFVSRIIQVVGRSHFLVTEEVMALLPVGPKLGADLRSQELLEDAAGHQLFSMWAPLAQLVTSSTSENCISSQSNTHTNLH